MSRPIVSQAIVFASITLFLLAAHAAQQPATVKPLTYSAIPAEAAKQANPVKSSPESIARAKKWWTIDCAMCHGASGDGKGDLAKDMKLQIVDFTNPDTLKDRSDGELFYIIKNGHNDMPAEGPRVKTEENWDLVNYVRSLAKPKTEDAQK
jgi:mono/diheme cytochrome c family protein